MVQCRQRDHLHQPQLVSCQGQNLRQARIEGEYPSLSCQPASTQQEGAKGRSAVRRHQAATIQLSSDLHMPQVLGWRPAVLPTARAAQKANALSHRPRENLTSLNSQTNHFTPLLFLNNSQGDVRIGASQMTAIRSAERRMTRDF